MPEVATYSYMCVVTLFVGYLFVIDIFGRPKPDPEKWNEEERKVIKSYHIALAYSFGAKAFSIQLNAMRWFSLVWVPWLLWNHLWLPAFFFVILFFVTASISVRLDPFFFLSNAVNGGQIQFSHELSTLQTVQTQLMKSTKTQQADGGNG